MNRNAILASGVALLILAGPGSGNGELLAAEAVHFFASPVALGINPHWSVVLAWIIILVAPSGDFTAQGFDFTP